MTDLLGRILERIWNWIDPDQPEVAFSCDHCGIIRTIPTRKVTVHVTAYGAEAFAAAVCPDCERISARKITHDVLNALIEDGAKPRPFRDAPAISENDVDRFVAALDRDDVIDLASEER